MNLQNIEVSICEFFGDLDFASLLLPDAERQNIFRQEVARLRSENQRLQERLMGDMWPRPVSILYLFSKILTCSH